MKQVKTKNTVVFLTEEEKQTLREFFKKYFPYNQEVNEEEGEQNGND